MEKYDLLVVGGGFSGAAAALAATRGGLNVLLVEQTNCLGGAANVNLVTPFMSYRNSDAAHTQLSCGIFQEIIEQMEQTSGKTSNSMFQEEYLKIVLQRMLLEAGVKLLFNTTFVRANMNEEQIASLEFVNVGGVITLSADIYIDATGDGNVAASAGCPFQLGREGDNLCQPMTLCFRMIHVDVDTYWKHKEEVQKLYKEYQQEGKIKNPREDILTFRTPINGILHFNSTRVVKLNPTDGFDVTKAELEAREQMFELITFMKEHAPGFENAELLTSAIKIGTRESRMIEGEYVLKTEDIMACTKFADGIAATNYDMDIHSPDGTGTYHWFLPQGEYYTVPYRCLLPKKADNLMVVGRCISTTHEAQASYRIMPVVCCIGEAAGTAIALAKKDNILPKNIDTDLLRKTLKDNGAFVG